MREFCILFSVFVSTVLVGVGALNMVSSGFGIPENTEVVNPSEDAGGEVFREEICQDEPFSNDFPMGTKIIKQEPHSRGWKQTGTFAMDLDSGVSFVSALMGRNGFYLSHHVEDLDHAGRYLAQWQNKDKKILWSLWRIENYQTGFSWGVSK